MFRLFDGNYMWSQAVLRMAFAGASVGEIFNSYDALADPAEKYDNEAWYQVWRRLGERLATEAAGYLQSDHAISAQDTLHRACLYTQWAVAFMDHDDPRRRESHRESLRLFEELARLSDIEGVEVPYEASSFPAWFVPADSRTATGEILNAAAIHFPGWDSTKEQALTFAQAMARRGVSTLLCDGPGIGEAVFRGLLNRHDYEVAGTAAFDYLASRADVDPDRIAIVGVSMGGYRSARTAAFEHRLAGAVMWGAIWDYYAVWNERLDKSERTAIPTPHAHALHVMGARDIAELRTKLRPWRLEGIAQQIRCPTLILHGEEDAQIPVEQAHRLYEAIGSNDKTLTIFTKETGGSAHCQNDNRILGLRAVGDWLYDLLVRAHETQQPRTRDNE